MVAMVGAYALAWGLFFLLLVTSLVLPLIPLVLLPFLLAGTFAMAAAPALTWWCLHDLACPSSPGYQELPEGQGEPA